MAGSAWLVAGSGEAPGGSTVPAKDSTGAAAASWNDQAWMPHGGGRALGGGFGGRASAARSGGRGLGGGDGRPAPFASMGLGAGGEQPANGGGSWRRRSIQCSCVHGRSRRWSGCSDLRSRHPFMVGDADGGGSLMGGGARSLHCLD
ncbi:unnamed protein product [Urochloa humidicola]